MISSQTSNLSNWVQLFCSQLLEIQVLEDIRKQILEIHDIQKTCLCFNGRWQGSKEENKLGKHIRHRNCFSPLQNFFMWEIGETCDNRGPALPPAPDFGSRLKPNILLLWRPNSRRRRRRRGDPTSPPLETPSCCCSTRSQPPLVSNHVGPDQSRLVLPTSFCIFVFCILYYVFCIMFQTTWTPANQG